MRRIYQTNQRKQVQTYYNQYGSVEQSPDKNAKSLFQSKHSLTSEPQNEDDISEDGEDSRQLAEENLAERSVTSSQYNSQRDVLASHNFGKTSEHNYSERREKP